MTGFTRRPRPGDVVPDDEHNRKLAAELDAYPEGTVARAYAADGGDRETYVKMTELWLVAGEEVAYTSLEILNSASVVGHTVRVLWTPTDTVTPAADG